MNKNVFFQGDVLVEEVEASSVSGDVISPASDGAIVLAEGEVTSHRHAFYDGGVTMFRDDGLARDIPDNLYIGHINVESAHAELKHEDHDTIRLPKGTYRIRRQREYDAGVARIVAD